MPRLSLSSKLLIAFLVVLLPMLGLIVYDYNLAYEQRSEEIIDAQLRTSQAVGALVDASMDDAFAIVRSFSRDPVLRTMDTGRIDPYLQELAASLPQYDNIAVLDLAGNAVGLMSPRLAPGAARPSATGRAYFETVKATRQPVVSEILISRATENPTAAVVVPMVDDAGTLVGMTLAALDLDYLAQRLATVGLRPAQAIFLTDPQGTMAFHTMLPKADWGRRSFADYAVVQLALGGAAARGREIVTPQGDLRMVAATRTAKYGWVVGVSLPASEALAPVRADLARRLLLFIAVLAFAGLVAIVLSRRVLLRPLEVLAGHLADFGRGDWGRRIDLRTGDEIELVAETFNQMAAKLEEATRQREEFVSVVAHDLRAPISVIRGYAALLQQLPPESRCTEREQRMARDIHASARRLERMVSDLLDVSRLEARRLALAKKPVDLSQLVGEIVERAREQMSGHTIAVEVRGPLRPVQVDPDRVEQVLGNLLSNAGKYAYPGSTVAVAVEPLDDELMVSVTNAGPGIPPEERERLFTRFFRSSRTVEERVKGLGLGLYIAKGLVEAHGGRMWIESEPGKYATFRFTLPVEGERAA